MSTSRLVLFFVLVQICFCASVIEFDSDPDSDLPQMSEEEARPILDKLLKEYDGLKTEHRTAEHDLLPTLSKKQQNQVIAIIRSDFLEKHQIHKLMYQLFTNKVTGKITKEFADLEKLNGKLEDLKMIIWDTKASTLSSMAQRFYKIYKRAYLDQDITTIEECKTFQDLLEFFENDFPKYKREIEGVLGELPYCQYNIVHYFPVSPDSQ